MFNKFIKFIFVLLLFYQTPSLSKSTSLDVFSSKDFSNYFSGIVAFENRNNSEALKFFKSSKFLINKHNSFLKRYIITLVLENKITDAINEIKNNKDKENIKFFDAHLNKGFSLKIL